MEKRIYQNCFCLQLLLLMILSSCENRSARLFLSRVEPILADQPQLALARLQNIDRSTLNTAKLRADYSLLFAMALDKNWIDTTDMDVVIPAVNYYNHRRPLSKRAKPYYYLGRIQFNGKNYEEAIISFIRAKEYADKTHDERFKALIEVALANTYSLTSVYADALDALEKAEVHCVSCGDSMLLYSINYYKAQNLVNSGCFQEANDLYEYLLRNDKRQYADMIPKVYADYAMFLITPPNEQFEEALTLYDRFLNLTGGFSSNQQLGMYAICLANLGREKEAKQFLNIIKSNSASDSTLFYYIQSQISANQRDYITAFQSLYSYQLVLDKEVQRRLRQSAVKAQRDYFALKNKAVDREASQRRVINYLLLLLLILVLMITYFAWKKYKEKTDRQNRDLMEIIQEILFLRNLNRKNEEDIRRLLLQGEIDNRTIYNQKQQNSELTLSLEMVSRELDEIKKQQDFVKQEFFHLSQESFKDLSKLCSSYYKHEGRSSQANIVCGEVRGYLKNIGIGANRYTVMEKNVNKLFNNVMVNLRAEHPNHRERFYQIACYLFAGFKIRTIALVLNQSEQSIYKTRSLLRKEIEKMKSPHHDDFLSLLVGPIA